MLITCLGHTVCLQHVWGMLVTWLGHAWSVKLTITKLVFWIKILNQVLQRQKCMVFNMGFKSVSHLDGTTWGKRSTQKLNFRKQEAWSLWRWFVKVDKLVYKTSMQYRAALSILQIKFNSGGKIFKDHLSFYSALKDTKPRAVFYPFSHFANSPTNWFHFYPQVKAHKGSNLHRFRIS